MPIQGNLHEIDFIIINRSNKHRNVSLSFFLMVLRSSAY